MLGAFAKSAQVPFHTWLADAMEGPTPVSALIHAATMVTAGVYLIARSYPLFDLAPTAADLAAFVGLATLLIAASIALVVTDLKRIIAYSTMSQIGYMIVGVSIGAYSAGLFHLMTHAFFKALLFMAAGSIIAAMAAMQNIDRMGGFRKAMPFTCAVLICGALALAGFPGTSGFFSKDEILSFAATRGGMYWIFAIGGYIGAIMTAFYSFRIVFRVVYGEPVPEAQGARAGPPRPRRARQPGHRRDRGHRRRLPRRRPPHRRARMADEGRDGRPRVRGAVRRADPDPGGYRRPLELPRPGLRGLPDRQRGPRLDHRRLHRHGGRRALLPARHRRRLLPLHGRPGIDAAAAGPLPPHPSFLVNRWYFDELIDALVYRPVVAIGRFANNTFERVVIQGIDRGTNDGIGGLGEIVRTAQSGFVRFYALLVIGGLAGLALYFLVAS